MMDYQKNIIFLFVNIFLLSACLNCFSVLGKEASSNYEKAVISFNAQELNSTVIHLKNSLAETPQHLPSRILNAKLLLRLGKGHEAEVELGKAEVSGADVEYILPYKMEALLLQRKFDKVLDIFDDYVNLYGPRVNNTVYLHQATALVGKHFYNKADRVFIQILENSPDNIKAILGRAQVALKKGKFIEAIDFVNEAVKLDGSHINALLMSAVVHQTAGEVSIAKEHVQNVLRINPTNLPARVINSVLLLEAGQLLAAKHELEQVLAVVPNEPGANFLNYLTSISLGKTSESEKEIVQLTNILGSISVEVKEDFPIFYYLSSVIDFQQGNYFKSEKSIVKYLKHNRLDYKAKKLHAAIAIAQKNFHSAELILSQLIIYQSADMETYSLLGKVLMVLGRYEKAESYFQKVLKMQPNAIQSTVNLATLYMLKGQYKQVASDLSQHVELNNSTEALLLLSKAYMELDEPKTALLYINTLLSLMPDDSYIYQLKGSALGLSGDVDNAKMNFKKALLLSPENSQALIHLARIDVFENNIEEAIGKLHKQSKLVEKNSAVLIELGDIYVRIRNIDDAEKMYLKVLSNNTMSFMAVTRLVSLYQQQDNVKKAIELTEKHLRKNQKQSNVHGLLGKLYYKNKQYKKAMNAFVSASKYSADKGNSLLELASFQMRIGLLEAAKKSLVKALAWNDSFVPAFDKLIAIAITQKDKTYTLELINQLKLIIGNVAKIDLLYGNLNVMLGNYKEASLYYQLSLEKFPSQQAVLGLYHVYKSRGHNEKIVALLVNWIAKHPNDLISSIALAETYSDMERYQVSLDYYLNLLVKFPKHPILLNNTALVYLSVQNTEKAAEMAAMAYEIIPDNVTVLDTKAWVEINRKNYQEALAVLRQGYSLDHNNGYINYHLAIALDKLGRREEAYTYLQAAALASKDFTDKKNAESMLKIWESTGI